MAQGNLTVNIQLNEVEVREWLRQAVEQWFRDSDATIRNIIRSDHTGIKEEEVPSECTERVRRYLDF